MAAQASPWVDHPRADEVVRMIPLPNGATHRRRYDLLGRLLCDEEPDGNQLHYQYDAAGYLRRIQQKAGAAVDYVMDSERRQLRTHLGQVEMIVQFGEDGSLEQSITSINGQRWTVEYHWDDEGRPAAIRYPQAADWLVIERQADDLLSLSSAGHEYCRAWRDTAARATVIDFANGAWTREELTTGAPLRVGRVTTGASSGQLASDNRFSYTPAGRLASVGDYGAGYDSAGRLVELASDNAGHTFRYDDQGRLHERKDAGGQRVFAYSTGPQVCSYTDEAGQTVQFEYDAVGRRVARHGPEGATRYSYNLLGLLECLQLPGGVTIRYLYDGFGRLVGRTEDEVTTYYIVDLDGHRLAEADGQGRVVATYLWVGASCVGRIDGSAGQPLTYSFHRSYGGRLAAIGDRTGHLQPVGGDDPFGADSPIGAGIPTFAGLFGDPASGLLHAGGRWYDPQIAQFLTPDSWFGDDIGRRLANPAFRMLDHTPGWTTRPLTPAAAYGWCNGDPLNYSDPSGHNWLGLIFTTISAFLWEMQMTSVSLQMHVINFILDTIMVIPVFRPIWNTDGYFRNSVYNLAAPTASYRLMVPFALILNGLLNVQDVCWTLGSVIWARGTELRKLEGLSKRELLLCENAGEYSSATQIAVVDNATRATGTVSANRQQITGISVSIPPGSALTGIFWPNSGVQVFLAGAASGEFDTVASVTATTLSLRRPLPDRYANQNVTLRRLDHAIFRSLTAFQVRNAQARAAGTVDATGLQIAGLTVTTPAGTALGTLLQPGDWIAIKLAAGTSDELRQIISSPGATIDLSRALPSAYQNQPVEITRLDQPVVKIARDGRVIARFVSFVRGSAVHFASQIPEDFPSDRLEVTEHLTAGVAKHRQADFPIENILLRMAQATHLTGYAADDFLRVSGGAANIARRIVRLRAPTDLFLDTVLPAGMERLEVVRMNTTGAAVPSQTATGDRVTCGPMSTLAPLDGLAIENTGAVTVSVERRIVKQILLDCQVDALPAPLQGVALRVDLLTVDATKRAAGRVTATQELTTEAGQATRFSTGQPVRVTKDGSIHAYGVVDAVDAANNKITLREPLPPADFPAATPVTVTLLAATNNYAAENVTAPGEHVIVQTPFADTLSASSAIRVRPAADSAGGAVRVVKAAPGVIAQVDSALPASHTTNLGVQRFVADGATKRTGVRAPSVRWKLTIISGSNPYTVGEEIFIEGHEESIGKVFAINGSDIILQDPIELSFDNLVDVYGLIATGKRTASARLDEGQVMVPSDPKALLTRREALEHHEMRHVWQGAVWGPFLLSLPIPWLFHLGFSFGDLSNSTSSVVRHIGLGGLDTLFALIAWGVGGAEGATELGGTISDSGRKTITFPAETDPAKIGKFTASSRLEINKSGEHSVFNVVDRLDAGARQVTLRFELDSDHFAQNDQVKISVSPFEEMRKTINTWFSLNLEQLWSDYIPTAWGRALSKLLNRDSWFPLIGIYPLAWLFAGRDRDRIPLEQDASYHSGDLYSTIVLSRQTRVHVGQFARIFAFINARGGVSDAAGLSKNYWGNLLEILTVELPTGGNVEDVAGAVPAAAANEVRFRENYYIPLQDRVENAVGVFFNALRPGTYQLKAPETLTKELVFKWAFDVSFLELSKVEVLDLILRPDPTQPVFETEEITFAVDGDSTADYRLRFPAGGGTNLGSVDRLRYSVPVLTGGAANATQDLEMTATYAANHPVFRGDGQLERINLTEAQRTNLCKRFTLTINTLPTRNVGPVKAGQTAEFEMPIAPVRINVGPPPAGATGVAQVTLLNPRQRPARLQFRAPATVPTAGDVNVELIFGTNPANRRTITFTVRVEPS